MIKAWFKSGSPWIWMTAGAVSINLLLVVGLLLLIAARGLGHFWPADIVEYQYQDKQGKQTQIIGEQVAESLLAEAQAVAAGHEVLNGAEYLLQFLVKTGNRDILGSDFRWIQDQYILARSEPDDLITVERREWGNFYGRLVAVKQNGTVIAEGEQAWTVAQDQLSKALELFKQIDHLQNKEVGAINYSLERLRLKQRALELKNQWDDTKRREFAEQKVAYEKEYAAIQEQLAKLNKEIKCCSLVVKEAGGREITIPMNRVVKLTRDRKSVV